MKEEWFVVQAILRVKEIPNNFVTFLEGDGGYAIVTFLTHEHVNYKVYNLKFEWAYYECL
jgi:hypothetical protein